MELNPPLITEAELQAELAAIVAESIGWQPLGMGVTCTLETRRRWCVESLAGSL